MTATSRTDAESRRIRQDARRTRNWTRWGPYLSERQWGTVREDYSADEQPWEFFPRDHARSRAYRWGEDGLLGFTDRECRLCFALALWNGRDPILKERLFGLSGPEGNHGEDVKDECFYLDATPTSSYMKALYKYPQTAFPYAALLEVNGNRGRAEREFELADTGVFERGAFDVVAEYAKNGPNDILIRITIANDRPERATLHLLPTLWFRNTWRWGCSHEGCWRRPVLQGVSDTEVLADHVTLGRFRWLLDEQNAPERPDLLFTENETNELKLFGAPNRAAHVKDAFHDAVVEGRKGAVNPARQGTKCAAHYVLTVPGNGEVTLRFRLVEESKRRARAFGTRFDGTFSRRIEEADAFYDRHLPTGLPDEQRAVARQGYANLLWSKQFYNYVVEDWLRGDAEMPPPPQERRRGRNSDWLHLFSRDVLSVPDKWEYPWFASWDLAFHMLPMARIHPDFAKQQLGLILREWYMHPNGQIPAYEWDFGDVNPPVHAWACWRTYKIAAPRGRRDRRFLAGAFQKLLLNFTWWVNRKDLMGRHVFSGGFLGLDNIGVFDRSKPLPGGGQLDQADATAWMAFYCGTMLAIAIELAQTDPAYEDIASKFFEHFVAIADAINVLGGCGLWKDEDGFYYDQLLTDETATPLRIRSIVGLIPLIAVEVLDMDVIERLPGFHKRMTWFIENRPDLSARISYLCERRGHCLRLLAIPTEKQLRRVLARMLDESELLSPFGIRSLSRYHEANPFHLMLDDGEYCIGYQPDESDTGLFGGNSNWRGPVWFPINYLLIEALERYHRFFGDALKVECPTGSGRMMTLQQVARELARRLASLFRRRDAGGPPWADGDARFGDDPRRQALVKFHEYFNPETGRGLGAAHQGWTTLVIRLYEMLAQSP